MKEVWKDIPGFEQFYQVSNLGNVMSKKKKRVLSPQPNSNGYLRVELKANGSRRRAFVHRLVAESFVKNNEDKPCVNHIDSNFLNNAQENLEWVTHIENIHHAINNGRFDEHFKKLTNALKESNIKRQTKSMTIR